MALHSKIFMTCWGVNVNCIMCNMAWSYGHNSTVEPIECWDFDGEYAWEGKSSISGQLEAYLICISMVGHNTNTIEHTCSQHFNFRALDAWAVNTSVTCFLTWRTKDNKRLDFIGKGKTVQAKHLCKLANDHNFAMEDHNDLKVLDNTNSTDDNGQFYPVLPASFTGSPKYFSEQTANALALSHQHGKPDLMITVTTNPWWPELLNSRNCYLARVQQRHPILPIMCSRLGFWATLYMLPRSILGCSWRLLKICLVLNIMFMSLSFRNADFCMPTLSSRLCTN